MLAMKARLLLTLLVCLLGSGILSAQSDEPLEIFGYFQPTYTYNRQKISEVNSGTFVVQQLNLFMQRDLSPGWLGLINIEFINSYSSSRRWGSLGLEEAWIRYRKNAKLNVKLGLHIPTFNHLNEIKNKTPLLPFITRPLAYETALSEVLPLEDLAPSQAYVSVYGTKPAKAFRLDYAVYLGNSPNIVAIEESDVGSISGEDTSDTFMVGSRLGFRWKTLKIGTSFTLDYVNKLQPFAARFGVPVADLTEIPRTRIGSDWTWDWKKFYSESEATEVSYHDLPSGIGYNLDFQYSLLGYDISDRWSIYTMTSLIGIEEEEHGTESKVEIWGWSPGFVFRPFYHISVKGQYHWIRVKDRTTDESSEEFIRFSGGVSIIF